MLYRGVSRAASKWVTPLLLCLLSLIVALACGEAFVRIVLAENLVLYPRYHAAADYGSYRLRRFRPNTVFWHTSQDGRWVFRINAQGFRADEDFTYEKPPGVARVLALGDSHTAGFEARQGHTFPEVIRQRLEQAGFPAQVINSGVSGFGTAEELAFLEAEGFRYAPDAVVLGFFANDFEDNTKAGLFALEEGRLVRRKNVHLPGLAILEALNAVPLLRWASENSYLYSLAMNTAWELSKRALLGRERAKLHTEYASKTQETGRRERELTSRLLERLYTACHERGVFLVVLDLPQASGPESRIKPSVPDEMIPFMRRHSDAFVDSREAFRAVQGGFQQLHVPHGQRHISEMTHEIVGALASREIERWLGAKRRGHS